MSDVDWCGCWYKDDELAAICPEHLAQENELKAARARIAELEEQARLLRHAQSNDHRLVKERNEQLAAAHRALDAVSAYFDWSTGSDDYEAGRDLMLKARRLTAAAREGKS